MIKRLLLLAGLLVSASAQAQMTIAEARTQPNGTVVTVKGIALNGTELNTSAAKLRYIQDATAGLALYTPPGSTVLDNVQRGDTVLATGTVAPFNNLFEINVTSVTVVNTGNPSPTAEVIAIPGGFAEATEGELVRLNNVSFTSSGTFANDNYDITDGTNTKVDAVRINVNTNLMGTPIPSGPVDLVGIMSQFNSTYQLLLRDLNDIVFSGAPPVLNTNLIQSNITPNGFTVSFGTQNNGNTVVRYGTAPNNLDQFVADDAQTTAHSVDLAALQPATIYYVQGFSVSTANDTSFSSVIPMATASLSTGVITVYFNRPVDTTVSSGTDAVFLNQEFDDTLKAYLSRAEQTIDILIYNIDNQNGLVEAINNAALAGKTVRMIFNTDVSDDTYNLFNGSVNKIKSPSGTDYDLMHNKMVIIDANHTDPNKAIYWTGSTNFTDQQLRLDANNIIIFQDQTIAKAATLEFNEMFGSAGTTPDAGAAKFGSFKSDNTPHEFAIGGKRVEMYFSPSEPLNTRLMQAIGTADNSIHFAIFAFTRNDIANAIKNEFESGVNTVQGLVDDTGNTGAGPAYLTVANAVQPSNFGIYDDTYLLHHKYAIVDAFSAGSDPLVVTGSYNWSSAATFGNDENMVIVHDATVANLYFQEWSQRFKDNGGTVILDATSANAPASKILLYPNPATNTLYVNYSIVGNDSPTFRLIDLTGRVVKAWQGDASNGNQTVDVSNLASGLYLLNVSTKAFDRTVRFEKQ